LEATGHHASILPVLITAILTLLYQVTLRLSYWVCPAKLHLWNYLIQVQPIMLLHMLV